MDFFEPTSWLNLNDHLDPNQEVETWQQQNSGRTDYICTKLFNICFVGMFLWSIISLMNSVPHRMNLSWLHFVSGPVCCVSGHKWVQRGGLRKVGSILPPTGEMRGKPGAERRILSPSGLRKVQKSLWGQKCLGFLPGPVSQISVLMSSSG